VAPKRTPEQAAEVGSFVNRLYEISGAPSWSEFARRAGVWSTNLSTWQTGTSVPEGWNLYSLVKEATRARVGRAEVSPDELVETALAAGPLEPVGLDDRLRSLEESVALTRRLVAESLGLQERERELEAELRQLRADQRLPAVEDGNHP